MTPHHYPPVILKNQQQQCLNHSFSLLCQVSIDTFDLLRAEGLPVLLAPAIGGLATGIVALGYPEILYQVSVPLELTPLSYF